eukprot:scaffold565_cov379-Pinguiococcus_pyrenoidosus.AAC.2
METLSNVVSSARASAVVGDLAAAVPKYQEALRLLKSFLNGRDASQHTRRAVWDALKLEMDMELGLVQVVPRAREEPKRPGPEEQRPATDPDVWAPPTPPAGGKSALGAWNNEQPSRFRNGNGAGGRVPIWARDYSRKGSNSRNASPAVGRGHASPAGNRNMSPHAQRQTPGGHPRSLEQRHRSRSEARAAAGGGGYAMDWACPKRQAKPLTMESLECSRFSCA